MRSKASLQTAVIIRMFAPLPVHVVIVLILLNDVGHYRKSFAFPVK